MIAALEDLRDRPFELLATLDERLGTGGSERGPAGGEWSGLAFTLADRRYLAPREDVREVLEMPGVTRVPGAKPWLLGVANVRGELLPIVDLGQFLGCQGTLHRESSRVVVLNDDELPAGFLVDAVGGFRGFRPEDQCHELADKAHDTRARQYLLGAFVRDSEEWQVFSLRKLARDAAFRDAGA